MTVEIEIRAIVDKAVADLQRVGKAVEGTGTSSTKATGGFKAFASNLNNTTQKFTGMNLATLGWIGAALKVVDITKKSIDNFIQYSNQIQDISRLTGESAEDMSRLVQVGDDVRLTYDQIKTSMQIATRQGIDVSIEGIKDLSAEYLALEPGLERSQFLLKTFGRSGAEMGRLLEMGADGIDKATAAVAKGLIMDSAAIKKAEALRLAKDNLSDSLTALGNILAGAVIPAFTWLVDGVTDAITWTEKFFKSIGRNINLMENIGKETAATAKTYDEYAESINNVVKKQGYLIDESGNLVQSFTYQGQTTYKLIEANYALSESEFLLTKDQEGLNQMVEEGIPYFGALTSSIQKSTGAMDEVAESTWKAADAFEELNTQQIFNVAAAGLDKDAQLALAREMGLLNETAFAQLTTLDVLKEALDTGAISANEYYGAVDNLDRVIKGLEGKEVTVNTYLNEYRHVYWSSSGTAGIGGTVDYMEITEGDRAGGGAMRPGGWYNHDEMNGAAPEKVHAGNGGYVNTTTNYNMTINAAQFSANDMIFGFRTMQTVGGA